jgi:hypothetical protein
VNKVFEQIALIPGLIAGAVVLEDGKLAGWCANSAIPPDHLELVGVTCRAILSATRAEWRSSVRVRWSFAEALRRCSWPTSIRRWTTPSCPGFLTR